MKQLWLQANEWFAQLAQRERWMVAAGAVVVIAAILFAGVWEPLAKADRTRAEALDAARATAARIEELASLAKRGQSGAGAANRSMSLLSAVDQASKSGTLPKPPARIQPEGEKEIRVWLEDVPFEGVVRWLAELETRYGIAAQNAEIERESAPGLVNARLTLVRP
ncbi:MAG TPA: type II secretion system protein GspM [Solimonas sp.]|nr:type II secretion system protein GspM [Solimonas sp.]